MTESDLTGVLRKIKEEGGQAYLVTNEECVGCEEAKASLKKEIDDKLLIVSDIQTSDKATDLVMALDLRAVPSIVVEHKGKTCLLDEATGKEVRCKIPESERPSSEGQKTEEESKNSLRTS